MKRNRLLVRLNRDEDGYPPVDFERLWIEEVSETTAAVDNIPFFTCEMALGDLVQFEKVGDELWYVSTLKRSGNSLIRLVYYPPTDPAETRRRIEQLGCETELDATHTLIAVSVPANVRLEPVQEFLASAEAAGELGYEEAILMHSANVPPT